MRSFIYFTKPPWVKRPGILLHALLMLLGLLVVTGNAQAQEMRDENSVKAAYLYNFVKFTYWPDNAFKSEESPLRLCVLGNPDMVTLLSKAIADKKVSGRSLIVLDVQKQEVSVIDCHVVYYKTNPLLSDWELVRKLRDLPVVTVGEGKDFIEVGGMISFSAENQRIRFIVNLPSAEQSGIRISSKLLNVAAEVIQK